MHIYLESLTAPGVRFEVVEYNKADKTATIRGEYGGQFTYSITKESLETLGYKLVKSETPLALVSAPSDVAKPKKAKAKVEEAAEEE